MLFLSESIEETGLADVWTTDEGDFKTIFVGLDWLVFEAEFGEFVSDTVAKIVEPLAGGGRHAEWIFDAKIQEFLVWQRLTEVGFVEQKQGWLAGFKGFFGDELVVVVWIFAAIEREQDKVGAFDGVIDLILDVSFKFVIWIFETSSVNEKVAIVDFGDDIVARSTRFARNNSLLATSEAIEETGLAGIGLADDCYYG